MFKRITRWTKKGQKRCLWNYAAHNGGKSKRGHGRHHPEMQNRGKKSAHKNTIKVEKPTVKKVKRVHIINIKRI